LCHHLSRCHLPSHRRLIVYGGVVLGDNPLINAAGQGHDRDALVNAINAQGVDMGKV
jgi:hypothetical protein